MADLEPLFAAHRQRGMFTEAPVGPCDLDRLPASAFATLTFDEHDPLLPHSDDRFAWPAQYDADHRDADRRHREGAQPKLAVGFVGTVPVLDPRWDWRLVQHTVGGHACEAVRLCVVPLAPTPAFHAIMDEAARRWRGAMLLPRADLDDITEWRSLLQGVGADCRHSYHLMIEGLYPIDATDTGIAAIAVEPPTVTALIDQEKQRLVSPLWTHCAAFVLAANSD